MNSLFNYSRLDVSLERKTSTLHITLNHKENNPIDFELLFELESLLSWAANKTEIISIFIDSAYENFSCGVDQSELKNYSLNQIEKLRHKLARLNFAMMNLPQIVVIDLGKGSSNLGSELSIGADMRISHNESYLNFDHANHGLIAASGALSILPEVINRNEAKAWVLSSTKITIKKLIQTGYVWSTYDKLTRNDTVFKLLSALTSQAPIQRIQTKFGFLRSTFETIENNMKMEKEVAKAAMLSTDWKQKTEEEFTNPKTINKLIYLANDKKPNETKKNKNKEKAKLKLVKTENNLDI